MAPERVCSKRSSVETAFVQTASGLSKWEKSKAKVKKTGAVRATRERDLGFFSFPIKVGTR